MDEWVNWLVLLTFVVSFLASILSGIGGGGGGFIMTPLLIFIGLTPQQAVATGKMGGIGVMLGSLMAFRGKGFVHKKLVKPLLAITAITSLIAAWLIPRIDADVFQKSIGLLLILLIPTLFINKASLKPGHRSRRLIAVGFALYAVIAITQGVFGTGLAMLLTLDLMLLFGLGALEANATKRMAQTVQTSMLFVLLLVQGLVVLSYGLANLAGSWIGSFVGTRLAIKKGDRLIRIILAMVMLGSGVALLL